MNPYLNIDFGIDSWCRLYAHVVLESNWPETDPVSSQPVVISSKLGNHSFDLISKTADAVVHGYLNGINLYRGNYHKYLRYSAGFIKWINVEKETGISLKYKNCSTSLLLNNKLKEQLRNSMMATFKEWIPSVRPSLICHLLIKSQKNSTRIIAVAVPEYEYGIFIYYGIYQNAPVFAIEERQDEIFSDAYAAVIAALKSLYVFYENKDKEKEWIASHHELAKKYAEMLDNKIEELIAGQKARQEI